MSSTLPTPAPPRLARWWMFAVALVFVLSAVACKNRRGDKDPSKQPPVTAKDPRAQEDFDRATELLQQNRWEEAKQAFRMLQTSYPEDPIATLAELYAHRADLQVVGVGPDGALDVSAPQAQVQGVIAGFEALARAKQVDDRVRFAAAIYAAIGHGALGQTAAATDQLEEYPSPSLGSAVWMRDRQAAYLMLTEALWRAKRWEDVLVAAAKLQRVTTEQLDASQAEPTPTQLRTAEVVGLYARARGFAAARDHIDDRELQMEYLVYDAPLARAAAAWALMQRRVSRRLDEEQRAALEDIYQIGSAAMVQMGALEKAAEMSSLMASIADNRPLILGALVPMSGKNRPIGQRVMRGMLLAQRAFGSPQGARVTLVFKDSMKDATQNVTDLVDLGALAIVGPIEQELAAAYKEAASQARVPLVLMTTEVLTRPGAKAAEAKAAGDAAVAEGQDDMGVPRQVGEGGGAATVSESTSSGATDAAGAPNWVFRNFIDTGAEARAVAQRSYKAYGDRRIVVLRPDVGYGALMAQAFRDKIEEMGGEVVEVVTYPRGATDYTRTAQRVARLKPDAIFIPDAGRKVAEVAAFLAKENIWGVAPSKRPEEVEEARNYVHYLGTSLWQDPFLLSQSGEYVQGATIPAWYAPQASDEASRAFSAQYGAIYGGTPSVYEAFAYDSVMWLREVLVETGMRRRSSVREALTNPAGFEGVTGAATFEEYGEAARTLRFVVVKGRQFKGRSQR